MPVVWLSLHPHIQSRGPWDTALLNDLFADELWPMPYDFEHIVADSIPPFGANHAVVVLPAQIGRASCRERVSSPV